jgi:prepilin-type N-terminal cleavage/methylation domain-containing protein
MKLFGVRRSSGFTLIEMIGVLAVIAILAGALLPAVIRQMQRAFGDAEEQTLVNISKGLELHILENKTIPASVAAGGVPAWDAAIATQINVATASISANEIGNPRYYVWDNAATAIPALPYSQTAVSAVAARLGAGQTRPRVMIVASTGPALTGIASGAYATASFDALWNWDGTGAVLNLTAEQAKESLRVERLNLAHLFYDVSLRSQPITQFGTAYFATAEAQLLIAVPANVTMTRISVQCPNSMGTGTTYQVDYVPTVGAPVNFVPPGTPTGTGSPSAVINTASGGGGNVRATVAGAVVNPNSLGAEIDYQATPNYQLDTGVVTAVPPGALPVNLSALQSTPLTLYSNDGATVLQSIFVNANDSFWYTPGPPEAWGR